MDEDSMPIQPGSLEAPDRVRRNILAGQIALILIVWLYPAFLHRQNDGLWFQGDAPRHAANGIFWKDFLSSGSLDPRSYALAYYARYPVISPAAYPPAFYILEGAAFAIFHPSPYLAKSLVLLFALGASFYVLAWVRRWISAEAGWSAALLPLLPGFFRYSNAIMLNVPATAASIAALYHGRRWIESSSGINARKHFYLAAAYSLLAALIYLPAGIVGCIIAAWLLAGRRWDLFGSTRTLLTALICTGLLVPWLWIAFRWAPLHASFAAQSYQQIGIAVNWIIYAKLLTEIAGFYPLVFAAAGFFVGLAVRRWRKEISFLSLLFIVDYVFLTVLAAREGRYGLLLCMPVVCCCGLAWDFLSKWISLRVNRQGINPRVIAAILGISLVGVQAVLASKTAIPRIQGMTDVVSYMEKLAPAEPVFYEGYYESTFTFYLQSRDPGFQRRVVLGRKLLYANAMNPLYLYQQFVSSKEDLVQVLTTQGGCRYILVEIGKLAGQIPTVPLLQEAVQGAQFEPMRSFPISGPGVERIDVYRIKSDFNSVDEIDLIFPALGKNDRFKVHPIRR